ncbi:DUF1059 domain-containing protein [Frankia sp. Mgl5]|uniref:DUF1059 domain-containing protein n=1 Tax=Frankia sp. Mgl5 TaxID=2933793 RepID=UPI0020100F9C|nr:DUF1059 domain-containing protein [Frankia sp. Mgl5]MCK9927043.1 DUF1059 domain-containing protein [Frankia sp. Mgl5]
MRRNRFWTAQALMGPRPAGDPGARVREVSIARPPAMKEFYCGAIIPGCEARFVAGTEDELLGAVNTHARVDHSMADVPAELVDQVRQGIRNAEPASLND